MSTVKVNTVTTRSGSTLTLGESGKTVALASGASQTGFGRTGTVNWQTSIKTATFTAASGEGYFCDTASVGAFTVNLPSSPSVGDIVAIKDYASNFATANLTIGRGGSNLNGDASDSVRNTDNESLTLVYADATKGWLAVEEGTGYIGEAFISASGGNTVADSGNCRIHTFTGPGTFTVNSIASCSANNQVSYVIVAGGGGSGGGGGGGGGGAGGYRETKSPVTPYTASPLCGHGTPGNRVTVTATSFPVVVGGGGALGPGPSVQASAGDNSSFAGITAAGGAGGGSGGQSGASLTAGGSGGGGRANQANCGSAGNTPPTTPAQGSNGGRGGVGPGTIKGGGGGGGATAVGADAVCRNGGAGGAGATSCITASPVTRAGGGGGGTDQGGPTPGSPGSAGAGGAGGGGAGGNNQSAGSPTCGNAGTVNTGGGAGGGTNAPGLSPNGAGGAAGGSGIVIIRYKFQ
tara:strand:+ start:1315 stop:2703 length:1389 start_codon:yes stop_codon:yes gene_type:complete